MNAGEMAAPGHAHGHAPGSPSPRLMVSYGFWIFLLSDFIIFSALFAAYAVLGRNYAGGPTAIQVFDLHRVLIETGCLLASSYTCGIADMSAERQRRGMFLVFAALTFVLGAAFLGLEINEFIGMVAKGAGPQRSAFLSAFFTLVGTHGLHVTIGLLWLAVMMAQALTKGLTPRVLWRLHCFSLFWHALDIIWVGVFTVVYLTGAH
jgi:cytochrome o ubiquinol oxidase subunit 3